MAQLQDQLWDFECPKRKEHCALRTGPLQSPCSPHTHKINTGSVPKEGSYNSGATAELHSSDIKSY